MKPRRFQKVERLLKRSQFEKVMARGRKRRVENICTVLFLKNDLNHPRLGIIASKKVGNAVIRNKAKRRIREIFRLHKGEGDPAMDIVVISGKKLVHLPFSILESKLAQTLKSIS